MQYFLTKTTTQNRIQNFLSISKEHRHDIANIGYLYKYILIQDPQKRD